MKIIRTMIALLLLGTAVFAQSGGVFEITQSVTGSGGGSAAGGVFSLDGTAGQTITEQSSQASYDVQSGFWQSLLTPTASDASISGRVTTADGRGIRNAVIELIGGNLTTSRRALTASLGYYSFEGLGSGETYILTVYSKRFTFQNPTRVVLLTENLSDLDFEATPIETGIRK